MLPARRRPHCLRLCPCDAHTALKRAPSDRRRQHIHVCIYECILHRHVHGVSTAPQCVTGRGIHAFALPVLHLLCSQSSDHASGRRRPRHCVSANSLQGPLRPRLSGADSMLSPRAMHSWGTADGPTHATATTATRLALSDPVAASATHPHATAPIHRITILPTHACAGNMALGTGEELLLPCRAKNHPARQCFHSGTMYIEHDTVAHSYIPPQSPAGYAGAETCYCRPGTIPPGLSGCEHDGPGE